MFKVLLQLDEEQVKKDKEFDLNDIYNMKMIVYWSFVQEREISSLNLHY